MKNILIICVIFIECFGYEIIIDKTEKLDFTKELTLVRDDYNDIVVDIESDLMWQDNSQTGSVKKDWNGAKRYCKSMTFAGYDDWTLPTIKELESIADFDNYEPASKIGFKNILSKYYWSVTPFVDNSGYLDKEHGNARSYKDNRYENSSEPNAWTVNFLYGSSSHQIRKTTKRNIRCVRKNI